MRDKTLERYIILVREFIRLWEELGEFLHLKVEEKVPEEKEKRFMELKSEIARKSQVLSENLEGGFPVEAQIVDIISQSPSLAQIHSTTLQIKKLQNDWHTTLVALNKILGSLENKREELARVSALGVKFKRFLRHPLTTLIFLIVVIFILYGLASLFLPPPEVKEGEGLGEKLKSFLARRELIKVDTGLKERIGKRLESKIEEKRREREERLRAE